MKRTTIFAVAALSLPVVSPATAAEMTLVRSSRPVTEAEVAGGAPLGGMVHNFYATSDADLLVLGNHFNHWVYQHPYGSDNDAPVPELVAYYPAAAADSFIRFPSSTIMLGGGFNGTDTEKAWGDLSNDGPQTDFLFGRLTTTEPGSFDGFFALRGQETYIEMPFGFTLPGTSGPFTETIYVTGVEPIQPTPSEPPLPEVPTLPEEETPTEPRPLQITPSLAEQLRASQADRPERSLEPNSGVLAMRAALQQNLAQKEGGVTEPESSPLPVDNFLNVTGMRAVYDPLTGNVEFEGLTNIHGIGVMSNGNADLNPSGALSAGAMLVAIPEEIGWLFLGGIAGGGFDGGAILEPGLSDELSNYYIGVASMGSGKSVTPIPIVSGSASYLPNFNPFAPAGVAAVPEPSAWMLGVVGLLSLAKKRREKNR